jgi:hypothetical protein
MRNTLRPKWASARKCVRFQWGVCQERRAALMRGRGRDDRERLCTARRVVVEILRDETYVDEDKIGGKVGLERQLIGKDAANEVSGVT